MSNDKYCPFCGALQEEGQKFCGSCGASIESTEISDDQNVKVMGETPITPTPQPGYQQPGSQAGNQQPYSYGSTTTQYQQPKKSGGSEKATIALVLGLLTLVVNCFILPIVGLVMVKQAKENHEDQGMITAASIVNWIFLCLSIIGPIVMIVIYATIGFSSLYP